MRAAFALTAAAGLTLAVDAWAQQPAAPATGTAATAAQPSPAPSGADADVARLRKLEAGIAKQLDAMSAQMEALREELARLRSQIDEYSAETKLKRGAKSGEAAVASGAAAGGVAVPAAVPEAAAPVAAQPPADTTPRIAIRGFRFSGNSVLSEAELEARVQPYVGQQVTIEQINDAIGRVRQAYLDKGYFLARTYLPEQDIRDGVIEVAVLEGKLGKVKVVVDESARVSEGLATGIVEKHLAPGDPITEAGLERPLLLLRDLPRITADSTIEAGTNLGEADLTVGVRQKPEVSLVTGEVGADNHGNRFTGQYRLGLGLNLNNPTGLADLVSFRGYLPNGEGTLFGTLGYVVPVGGYGTKVGLNLGRLNYTIGKDFAALGADGIADVLSAFAVHPVIRTRGANLFAQVTLEDKWLTDRQENISLEEERVVRAVRLQASGDARDSLLGLNVGSLAYTWGNLEFDSPGLEDLDQSAAGFKTGGGFQKVNYEYQRLQQIVPDVNALFSITGQWASKNLTSAEKMSLGGPSAVRAYPLGEDTGDEGYYGTVELRYTGLGMKLVPLDIMVSAFYDFGLVRFNAEPADAPSAALLVPNRDRLAGYGLGLNFGREGNFMFRSSLAWRSGRPPLSDLSENASREPRIWMQAIKWF